MTTKLPIAGRGSAAASTAFCATRVEGPGGYLWIDGNGKITAGNGTLEHPRPNAFSLPPGNRDDRRHWCPGSTSVCRAACYVHGLEAAARATFDSYAHNGRMLLNVILAGDIDVSDQWARILADWITHNAEGGFRWHVSGDVTSAYHAAWILMVCLASPKVQHWIYTRTFNRDVIAALTAAPNLAVNLSVDAENLDAARAVVAAGWPVRLCYLTTDGNVPDDLPPGSVIFPDYALRAAPGTPAQQRAGSAWWQSLDSAHRAMVCPVDFYSKSELLRCGPCRRCIDTP